MWIEGMEKIDNNHYRTNHGWIMEVRPNGLYFKSPYGSGSESYGGFNVTKVLGKKHSVILYVDHKYFKTCCRLEPPRVRGRWDYQNYKWDDETGKWVLRGTYGHITENND